MAVSKQTSFNDVLEKVINKYNNQTHRTIKTTPNEMYDDIENKFLILRKMTNITET